MFRGSIEIITGPESKKIEKIGKKIKIHAVKVKHGKNAFQLAKILIFIE